MSGVLEAVASAAGLTSLAIQIVENIHKIQKFYSAVKNAPEETKSLVLELELLGSVLAEYSSQDAMESLSSLQNEVSEQCRAALGTLYLITNEICIGCGARRHSWTSVKALMKRKKLEEILTKIERLKTTLILAHLQSLQSVCSARPKHLLIFSRPSHMKRHALMETNNTQHTESPSLIRAKQEWRVDLVIGVLAAFETIIPNKDNSSSTFEIRFTLARWISNSALGISTYFVGSQMQRTLTVYTFVDHEAAIFKACAAGDDVLVQQLIDTGNASPFDVTNKGLTPLHVAAAFHHPRICEKLLSLGADACASTWGYNRRETPLRLASDKFGLDYFEYLGAALPKYYSERLSRQSARRILVHDTLRVLVEKGNAEIELFWDPGMRWGTSESLLHLWGGTSEDFLWAASEERLQLHGDDLQEFYISLALHSPYHDPDIIDLAIEKVVDLPSLAQARTPRAGGTILHGYLSSNWILDHRRPPKLPINAMKKVIAAGVDIHAMDSSRRTPLMAMALAGLRSIFYIGWLEKYGYSTQPSAEPVDGKTCHVQLLVQWTSLLEREGLDLNKYFQREKELGAERWIEMCEDEFAGYGAMSAKGEWFVRLIFAQHEPNGDIKARFEYRILEKRRQVPGAWLEDIGE